MPEIQMPTEKDWEYFFSFETPKNYLNHLCNELHEDQNYVDDKNFILKMLNRFAKNEDTREHHQVLLRQNLILKRARIYCVAKDNEEKSEEFRGYGPVGSFVPPSDTYVPEGRVNPENVIYLYTASDIRTAIAEVNPQIGMTVSVADIRIGENLNLLNFANFYSATAGPETSQHKWMRLFVLALTEIFNVPATKEHDYRLCQYVSSLVKDMGFDGVAFYSCKIKAQPDFKPKGICYTIFNYKKCEAISSNMYYIRDHIYTILEEFTPGNYRTLEDNK